MIRKTFLEQVVSAEDKIRGIYDQAARRLKRFPLATASRTAGKVLVAGADERVHRVIFDSIMKGAEMGDAEAAVEALREMVKRWPSPKEDRKRA